MTFYSLNPYHVLTVINSCGDLPITFGAMSIIIRSFPIKLNKRIINGF